MATSDDSSLILSNLSDAIKGDDIGSLTSILSTNPEILDLAAQIWPEGPLILAYNSKSQLAIKEIGRKKPEFARTKNQDGDTILHLACAAGEGDMVSSLVQIDSRLCLVEDNSSMIPLHTAIKHGRGDAVRELVSACPESLATLTSQLETVFHVAVKHNCCDVFEFLGEEARKLEKEYLLEMKDVHGNNLLHLAVSNQLVPLVAMLLPCNPSSRTTSFFMRVNSTNKQGHTALDLCNMNHSVSATRIRLILIEAGAIDPDSSRKSERNGDKGDVVLVILAVFIGVVFTVSSALPTYFPKANINVSEPFQFEAMASGRLPLVFYFLVCLTVTLTISACFLTVQLYKLPLGYLLFLSGIAVFFLYILLADYIMPEFLITLGSHEVSSYRMMWILALSYIVVGTLILLVGKYSLMGFNKFADWMKKRTELNKAIEIEMTVVLCRKTKKCRL